MSDNYLVALIAERDIHYEIYRVSLKTVKILQSEIDVIRRRFEDIDRRLPDALLRELIDQTRPLSNCIEFEYVRMYDTRARICELNAEIEGVIYRMGHVGPVGA
jgi:hypothetical protein